MSELEGQFHDSSGMAVEGEPDAAPGIGRATVHEFVHQLLPTASIHDSTDVQSYEYASAARREQYFGEMHWDLAWPLLQERIGRCVDGLEP